MENKKNYDTLIMDFGASNSIIGVYDSTFTNFALLETKNIQNGLLNSLLFLHNDLTIDLEYINSIHVFSKLKQQFINDTHDSLVQFDVILKVVNNVETLEEAQDIYKQDKPYYMSLAQRNTDLYSFENLNEAFIFEYDNEKKIYSLKMKSSIRIAHLIKIFFYRIKQEAYINFHIDFIQIVYALPVQITQHKKEELKNLLNDINMQPILVLSEPEAAVLAYEKDLNLINESSYLVIDSGAFSTDACLIHNKNNQLIIELHNGENNIGGESIDTKIEKYWQEKYNSLPLDTKKAILEAKMFLNENPTKMFYYYENNDTSYSSLTHPYFDFNKTQNIANNNTTLTTALKVTNNNTILINQPFLHITDRKLHKDGIVYSLDYPKYLELSQSYFAKYGDIILRFNKFHIDTVILCGGSNLNRFVLDYWKRQTQYKLQFSHIFDAVILGLKTAYEKKLRHRWNIQYVTPIDISFQADNKSAILIPNNQKLPIHNKIFKFKGIKENFSFYLGAPEVKVNTYKMLADDKYDKDTPISFPLIKPVQIKEIVEVNKRYNQQNHPILMMFNLSIDESFNIKISITLDTDIFVPHEVKKYNFDNFNQIYLEIAQKKINQYEKDIKVDTNILIMDYLKDFKNYFIQLKQLLLKINGTSLDAFAIDPSYKDVEASIKNSHENIIKDIDNWMTQYNSLMKDIQSIKDENQNKKNEAEIILEKCEDFHRKHNPAVNALLLARGEYWLDTVEPFTITKIIHQTELNNLKNLNQNVEKKEVIDIDDYNPVEIDDDDLDMDFQATLLSRDR